MLAKLQSRVYAPRVAATNGDDALKALDVGQAEGFELTIRADDGYGFWAFMPDR